MNRRLYILLAIVLGLNLAFAGTPPTQKAPQPQPVPPGMVLIPGGTFMMGCTVGDKECRTDEMPRHQIKIDTFYMDRTEVTVEHYRNCVDAGKCVMPEDIGSCNWGQAGREKHPVNCVGLEEAKNYCSWLGKRLPTEAEWEYAARGGHSDWKYPWDNEEANCSQAVMDDSGAGCGKGSTWPVGSKGTFGFGLEDMAGNVMEWVADYCPYNYQGVATNDKPLETGKHDRRVVRGGAWKYASSNLRVSARVWEGPKVSFGDRTVNGFRCAKSVE